jgi:HAE1 family hydrophobic/amphiphilic exporter-1
MVIFGIIGLLNMPYQLSPDVTEPVISVSTLWLGATPYEVERDIIEEQEKVLKGLPGLIEMESSSANSYGSITLRFKIGTNVDDALLRVSNKMNEVPSYPENVEKPIISATGASTSPVIWMILKTEKNNPASIDTYLTFFEDEIKQYLERVNGVAELFMGGGTHQEMHVIAQPEKLAAHHLTIGDIVQTLQAGNANISAGILDVGRRAFRIRSVAEFSSPEEILGMVVKSDGEKRVTIADVAEVKYGYEKRNAAILFNREEGIALGVKPEPGVNILDLTDRVEKVVKTLNEEKLKPRGVYIEWVYDERPYIRGAIGLVRENIFIGSFLAIIILLIFLRSIPSTIVISLSIPISAIGTFFFMNLLGRNLNVVSLAGIAFAVGMLVDNAIVVLENIDRHRVEMAESPFSASYYGTREVWIAILASSLTTVAVFLPVIFIQEEAGQLFRDIAIAITFSILLSLLVSITVVPMFSRYFLSIRLKKSETQSDKSGRDPIGVLGKALLDFYMLCVRAILYNWATRLLTVLGFTAMSVYGSYLLMPKMEYLPQGNRNFILNILIPPPGLSYKERKEIGDQIFQSIEPYYQSGYQGMPGLKNVFYVGADQFMFCGAMTRDEQRAGEMVPLFMKTLNSIPGMIGVSYQAGVFQSQLRGGRTVSVDLSGTDINQIVQAAGPMFGMIMREIPNSQVRPVPSLELQYPEVKIVPDRERLKTAGMNAHDFGFAVDVIMDGRKIGEFKREGQKKIDLVLKAPDAIIKTPEDVYNEMVATPKGDIIPVSSLARFESTVGMTEIRHLERNRTISLEVTPPETITVQECIETIQQKILPSVKAMGMLKNVNVRLSGTADKLTEMRQVLQWNIILAAIITYLLMAAIFGNFVYPLIIMITIPLASVGGLLGLKIVNIYSARPVQMDVLTILGFIILIGTVVNNAILIVDQSLNNIRMYAMAYKKAVLESVRTRIRPIYMTALTTVFGMLPLVVAPGPGSEFYRSLGSVILGGLLVSTIFTIFIIPALLMFFIKMEKKHLAHKNES